MNENATKAAARRSYIAAPKTLVRFKSVIGHYNPTTGKPQDANIELLMEVIVKNKLRQKDIVNNVVFRIVALAELFSTKPIVDDIFIINNEEFTIHSYELNVMSGVYVFEMVA